MVGAATVPTAAERVRAKRAALARQPLLAGCSPLAVRRVAAVADEVHVAAGDVIVEQGRHGLWFFMIAEGQAERSRDGIPVDVIGPGAYFGEAAVLRQVLQPATVRALSDMTLFVVGCQRLVPLVRDVRTLRSRLGDVVPRPHSVPPAGMPSAMWATPRPAGAHPPPLPPRRRTRLWVALSIAATALVVAAAWHPPLAVVAPGPTIDIAGDITVTGAPSTPVNGRYLVPTVRTSHPTLLGLALALRHPNRRIVSIDDVVPPGSTRDALRRNGAAAFERSQRAGAAAGVAAAHVDARVHIRPRPVSGPSAGLAYALAVEDILDPIDRAQGRTIVATGDMSPTGAVSPVGYVAQKAAAASGAGATVLLVPDAEVTDAWDKGVDVRGVSSLLDALAALR